VLLRPPPPLGYVPMLYTFVVYSGQEMITYTWLLSVLARGMHNHRTLAFRSLSCPLFQNAVLRRLLAVFVPTRFVSFTTLFVQLRNCVSPLQPARLKIFHKTPLYLANTSVRYAHNNTTSYINLIINSIYFSQEMKSCFAYLSYFSFLHWQRNKDC